MVLCGSLRTTRWRRFTRIELDLSLVLHRYRVQRHLDALFIVRRVCCEPLMLKIRTDILRAVFASKSTWHTGETLGYFDPGKEGTDLDISEVQEN